jgi:hypothetical protein
MRHGKPASTPAGMSGFNLELDGHAAWILKHTRRRAA